MEKTVKMTLDGKKTSRKWASGQSSIYEFEQENNPRWYSDPVLEL